MTKESNLVSKQHKEVPSSKSYCLKRTVDLISFTKIRTVTEILTLQINLCAKRKQQNAKQIMIIRL